MGWDSYNESINWGGELGAFLRTLTPQMEASYEASIKVSEAEQKLRLAKELLADAKATAENLKVIALTERDDRLALCERATTFLNSTAFMAVEAEAERVPDGSAQSEFLTSSRLVAELASQLSDSDQWWHNWAEKIRLAETKRKKWWSEQSDAEIISIQRNRLKVTLDWLEGQIESTPATKADFLVRYESGQGKIHRQGWVISPEGESRMADEVIQDGRHPVANRWFPVGGELVLLWEKSTVASTHVFTVVDLPTTVTAAQVEEVREILVRLDEEWGSRRGISGTASPKTGLGWINPKTGISIAYGGGDSLDKNVAAPAATLEALAARFKK